MTIARIQAEVAAEVERIKGEASPDLDDMIDSAEHASETAAICYTAASRKDRRAALVKTAAYALLALEAMDEADKPEPGTCLDSICPAVVDAMFPWREDDGT